MTQEIEKEYSLSIEQEQDMMAKFFYSSMKAVYMEILNKNKVRADITSAIIEDYIAKNPFNDVLDQTKDLFQRMPIISQRNLLDRQFIGIDDFTSAIEDIKHIYYSSLPFTTLRKYKEGMNLFFERIRRFGCSEIMDSK